MNTIYILLIFIILSILGSSFISYQYKDDSGNMRDGFAISGLLSVLVIMLIIALIINSIQF